VVISARFFSEDDLLLIGDDGSDPRAGRDFENLGDGHPDRPCTVGSHTCHGISGVDPVAILGPR
jgi:hypothetical protein